MKTPNLVVCDSANNAIVIPELLMTGAANGAIRIPSEDELIPLPESALLFSLPSRIPVGFDPEGIEYVQVRQYCDAPVFAASAFMPPGYVQTMTSAYDEMKNAPRLPLFCYSAVGWRDGRFYAAGYLIDNQPRHEIKDRALSRIDKLGEAMLKKHDKNRLIRHLVSNCVHKYRCPNACNLVLGRWECPVPVSKACNAACLGCISQQPKSSCVPSTQHRLDFTPTSSEIIEYVVPHLEKARSPIASFGQGCEGEPLLEAELIEKSIRGIRRQTRRGVINLNTNASIPEAVERLCRAGLNSMRVSMNSAQPKYYKAYYRPKNYTFEDVIESILIAKKHKICVSINYLVFPGLTDNPTEQDTLFSMLDKTGIDMIQTRNLNIDPAWYAGTLGLSRLRGKPSGMVRWIEEVRKNFPSVKLGYFNPSRCLSE